MSRDYKKHFLGRNVRRKKLPGETQQGIFWALMAAFVITLCLMWLYKTHHLHKPSALSQPPATVATNPTSASTASQSGSAQADSTQSIHFDFYDTLPKTQVSQPMHTQPAAVVSLPVKPAAKVKQGYFILIGSFHSQADAASRRLSLLLSGIDTSIVQSKTNGKTVWQIQKGPYSTEKYARSALSQLKRKGVEGYLVDNG